MSAFQRMLEDLKAGKALLGLMKDPTRTEQVFKLSEIAIKSPDRPAAKALVEHLMAKPEFSRMYEERYLPSPPSLEELSKLPAGTLGRAFFDHMNDNRLAVDFFPVIEADSPVKYIVMRLRQTHDIWHVVCGYGTDVRGEIALQAFMLSQIPSALSGSLLAGGLLHCVKNDPTRLTSLMDAITEGFTRGRGAKPLATQKWEERWSERLDRIRAELGIDVGAQAA